MSNLTLEFWVISRGKLNLLNYPKHANSYVVFINNMSFNCNFFLICILWIVTHWTAESFEGHCLLFLRIQIWKYHGLLHTRLLLLIVAQINDFNVFGTLWFSRKCQWFTFDGNNALGIADQICDLFIIVIQIFYFDCNFICPWPLKAQKLYISTLLLKIFEIFKEFSN